MTTLREVSKEDFYKFVGPLDVHPVPEGSFPYVTSWQLRDRSEVARIEPVAGTGWPHQSRYYIRG